MQDIIEKQKESWNSVSSGWKKWNSFVMEWLQPIGAKLVFEAKLSEKSIVLDAATGTGEPGLTAAKIARKGIVVGIDLSEGMVKIANENAEKQKAGNYNAIVADACKLPFPSNYFDAMLCRHGIMFVPDMDACLREFSRVLKPKARLCVSVWNVKEKNPWATVIGETLHELFGMPLPSPDEPGIFRCAESGTVSRLMKKAGFGEIKEFEITGKIFFLSPGQYWEYTTEVAAPIAAALKNTDSVMRERARLAVIEKAGKFLKNGKIELPWSAWVASGTK